MSNVKTEKEIPVLAGWITLAEAAERLGVSRTYMYRKAKKMSSIHRLGNQSSYVVSVSEVENLVQKQLLAPPKAEKVVTPKLPAKKEAEPVEEVPTEFSLESLDDSEMDDFASVEGLFGSDPELSLSDLQAD